MSNKTSKRMAARMKRKMRIRAKIRGTEGQPRLCVFRSCKHIYAQIIDDKSGATLASASSLTPELRKGAGEAAGTKAATMVGKLIGERCKEKGIEQVVFDRNGFTYKKNGRIAKLAEGARKAGLKF